MPAKKFNAFSRAMQEAQSLDITKINAVEPTPVADPTALAYVTEQEAIEAELAPEPAYEPEPAPPASTAPARTTSVRKPKAVAQPAPAPTRGVGRPRGKIAKKQFTYYLPSDSDEVVERIQIELASRARILIRDKSEVVTLALAVLESSLQDQNGLKSVLTTYRRNTE